MNTEYSLSALIMQKLNENGGEFTLTDIVDIATQNAEYAVAHYAVNLEVVIAKRLHDEIQKRNDAVGNSETSIQDQYEYNYHAGAIQAYNDMFDIIGPESRYFYASVAKEKEELRHDDRQSD